MGEQNKNKPAGEQLIERTINNMHNESTKTETKPKKPVRKKLTDEERKARKERDPERFHKLNNAKTKRYRERLKQDPVKWEAYLAKKREYSRKANAKKKEQQTEDK